MLMFACNVVVFVSLGFVLFVLFVTKGNRLTLIGGRNVVLFVIN